MPTYNPKYQVKKRSQFSFSQREIKDLALAWVALGLIFAWVMSGSFNPTPVFISLFTVGIGFLLHELAHKFVAQYYGCRAEFKADKGMLIFAAILAFATGLIFAAPGAVVIHGVRLKKHLGIIAAAGPITNIALALVFFFIPGTLGNFGYLINVWLALFNMIPLGPLDGKKIISWDKLWYWIITLTALLLLFINYAV